jgi:hypothetical protein
MIRIGKTKSEVRNRKNKRERMIFFRYRPDHLLPMKGEEPGFSGKVSFCTPDKVLNRASLSVETAFVLPIFFLGTVMMISFMDVYKLETEHLVKLCEKAKETGMYAYVLEGSGPEEITLPDVYTYEPVGGWISLPTVWLHNTVKVHAWTGKTYSEEEAAQKAENTEKMVYVTESGSVYHRNPGCTYLDLSINQVSGSAVSGMKNVYGQRYTACEVCSRNQSPAGSVYVTGTGTSYHNLGTCSGLKRTVRLVEQSQVSGMHACSRCGGE